MDKERKLYDKFVDKLTELLDNPEISDKELRVINEFLKNNNIQATEKNEAVANLLDKYGALTEEDIPFLN